MLGLNLLFWFNFTVFFNLSFPFILFYFIILACSCIFSNPYCIAVLLELQAVLLYSQLTRLYCSAPGTPDCIVVLQVYQMLLLYYMYNRLYCCTLGVPACIIVLQVHQTIMLYSRYSRLYCFSPGNPYSIVVIHVHQTLLLYSMHTRLYCGTSGTQCCICTRPVQEEDRGDNTPGGSLPQVKKSNLLFTNRLQFSCIALNVLKYLPCFWLVYIQGRRYVFASLVMLCYTKSNMLKAQ